MVDILLSSSLSLSEEEDEEAEEDREACESVGDKTGFEDEKDGVRRDDLLGRGG